MNPFILAIQFLTPLPLGRVQEVCSDELKKTIPFFPFVGILQGLILGGSAYIFYRLLPYGLASGLVLLSWVLITGALHLDGLADTVDGLAGGRDKKEVLDIMRRGNVGPFGMIAIFMVLLLKYLSIDSLSLTKLPLILFLSPLIGKVSIVCLNYLSSYAREEEGLGRVFVEGTNGSTFLFTVIITILLMSLLMGYRGIVIFFILMVCVSILRLYLKMRIGGITGDTMGATAELSEVIFLIGSSL